MSSQSIDGKGVVNTLYHGAVVTGLALGLAKLTKVLFKGATVPKLDLDGYDVGMMALDVSVALALRDVLVRQGIIPDSIMK